MIDFVIPVLLILILIILLSPFHLYLVVGDSMLPTLKNGQIVLCKKVSRRDYLVNGQIYVYHEPTNSRAWVVKRLSYQYCAKGKYYFIGDNTFNSRDSRNYGLVDRKFIIARVIYFKETKKGG